jgi:hypothetical protein
VEGVDSNNNGSYSANQSEDRDPVLPPPIFAVDRLEDEAFPDDALFEEVPLFCAGL